MKKWYYILFVMGLFLFSQMFEEYVMVHGILTSLIVGLIIAFICKLLFEVVTKTVIMLVIIGAIVAFLFSTGFWEMPAFIQDFWSQRETATNYTQMIVGFGQTALGYGQELFHQLLNFFN